MNRTRTILATIAALGATMVGCETVNNTQVTVMNETPSSLLVDVMRAGSETVLYDDSMLDANGVKQFVVVDEAAASVQIGIRPVEFESAPAQWVEFPVGGPYLLRVQGSATDLRFLPSLDNALEPKASDLKPTYRNRRIAEPPVQPSR